MDNARKKTSQLLHFAGMEVQDIFEDFQHPGPIQAEGDNAYKVAIRKLDFYFRVEKNIPYERHVFASRHCRRARSLTSLWYA